MYISMLETGKSKFEKDLWYRSKQAVWILLFTSFWIVDFLFDKDCFPTKMWQLVLKIF
jgi:hypothetical protein